MAKKSIIKQFSLFIIFVCIVPLVLVGTISYNISSSIIKEQATRDTKMFMENQKDFMEIIMGEVESLIANISSIEEIKESLGSESEDHDDFTRLTTQAKIGNILSGYTHLEGLISIDIFTMGNEHYHVGDTLNVQSINENVKDRIFAAAAVNPDKVVWLGVKENINENSLNPQVITAAKALEVINPNTLGESIKGLLVVNYSIDRFYDYFFKNNPKKDFHMMIIDKEGRLVLFPDKSQIGTAINFDLIKRLNKWQDSFTSYINGEKTIVTYSKSDKSGWTLVVMIPMRSLVHSTAVIRNSTILVLGICILIVLIAAISIKRKVVDPIKKITDLFKKIQKGTMDLNFRLKNETDNEVGELARWFDVFLDSLVAQRQAEEKLRKAHDELEERVQERTAELAAMNETLIEEIRQREKSEKDLLYLSYHDPLTRLNNRARFEDEMQKIRQHNKTQYSIIICDVDGLKLVNDSMGHKSGDLLLIHTARILESSLEQKNHFLARIGGDEFIIILYNMQRKEAKEVSKSIKSKILSYNSENPKLPLSISIGLAVHTDVNQTVEDVFKEADNNTYREKLYRSNSARSALVRTMMKALEERDLITEGHAERVQNLALKMGKELGFSSRGITDLKLFAQFHDIGKVGVTDRILFKKGTLNSEEMHEMKRHPEIGYRIAQSAPDLAPISDWILKHHEWWDGNGYPLKLKGEEIPIECRIISIADAYDAMTSERPYRKMMSHEEAIEEILRCAGTQFDPNLVRIFIDIF